MKRSKEELVVFGGSPAFTKPLHVGRPNIGNRDRFLERVNDILDRRWLTNGGDYVREFEQRIADFCGVKHCIAMCNGTVALENTIRAIGLSGEVIVPSFTFIGTVNALQWQEITPVFCDIDPRSYTIDPARIEEMITPRTTGIIGVHLWGRSCDIESLAGIAQRNKLKLIFDAAHALGCTHRNQRIGQFGNAEVFSFHATKFINTMEGGAVVTNDDQLARKLRLMKNFGFTAYDRVEFLGVNGKMNEICAAMGLTTMEAMDAIVETNKQNYEKYLSELGGVPGLTMLKYDDREQSNYQYIIFEVNEKVACICRDALVHALHNENILARRYFYPGCHRMEPYSSYFPHAGLLLPVTEQVAERVFALPTGSGLNDKGIEEVAAVIRLVLENASCVQRKFESYANAA